jgi:hypothetical protein
MPPQPHQLVVTYWQGKMEAGCTCGRWDQEELLCPGECPSQLMAILELAFAGHVAEAGGQEVQIQQELVFITDWGPGLARERKRKRNHQRERLPQAAPRWAALGGPALWLTLPVITFALYVSRSAPNTSPRNLPPVAPPVQTTAIPVLPESHAQVSVVATTNVPFQIDPNTPSKDLLPVAPKVEKPAGPVLSEDLAQVPEVELQAAPAKMLPVADATRDTEHLIAKINHLNGKKADGFLEALRGERADLAGLPFAMGDECRTKNERSRQFALAVANVRRALQSSGAQATLGSGADRNAAEIFWCEYQVACVREDQRFWWADQAPSEPVTLARIAALMQVLAPEAPSLRLGLVKYMASVSHVEATRALARLVLFSIEDEVRRAAGEALQSRRKPDYTDVLISGLRYPWPAVERRAAEALVQLKRTDLVPQLVALLGEPDPRAPVVQEVNKKRVNVVRELVRIHHHRNCLLCHAPGSTGRDMPETLTAAIPVPGMPSPAAGYQPSSSDLVVRIDVTYLRQDFSLYQPVLDAQELRRFDFLVRTRELTEEEAAAYREKLARGDPRQPSRYQQVVLAALLELP